MPTYTSLWNLYVCVDIKCILVHSLKIFFNEVFASLFQNVFHFPRGGFPPPPRFAKLYSVPRHHFLLSAFSHEPSSSTSRRTTSSISATSWESCSVRNVLKQKRRERRLEEQTVGILIEHSVLTQTNTNKTNNELTPTPMWPVTWYDSLNEFKQHTKAKFRSKSEQNHSHRDYVSAPESPGNIGRIRAQFLPQLCFSADADRTLQLRVQVVVLSANLPNCEPMPPPEREGHNPQRYSWWDIQNKALDLWHTEVLNFPAVWKRGERNH